MIKVCGISDMHGNLDFKIKECDILCICGDIVPLTVQKYHEGTFKWIKKTFIPWCNEQPCEKIFLIGGNHDLMFEVHPDETRDVFKDTKITYLMDESAEYTKGEKTIKIYGTPWCHQFFDWAFMTDDEHLTDIYKNIPEDVDILLTHDCSYGSCDVLLQKTAWNNAEHVGCKPLAEAVKHKKPKIQLSGHLHSGRHSFEWFGNTQCTNVSLLDETYKLIYDPTYFEI